MSANEFTIGTHPPIGPNSTEGARTIPDIARPLIRGHIGVPPRPAAWEAHCAGSFFKRAQRPGRRKSGSVLGWTATGHRLTAVGLGPTDRGPFEGLRSSTTVVQSRFGSVAPTLEGMDRRPGGSLAEARRRLTVGGLAPSALGQSVVPAWEQAMQNLPPARSHASPVRCQRLAPIYRPEYLARLSDGLYQSSRRQTYEGDSRIS